MKKMLVGFVLTLASAAAAAQDAGFYIGVHIGQAMYRETCDDFTGPGLSCDDKDSAWKVLGGYQFNKHFAAEIGYVDLGTLTARGPGGTLTADVSAFELVAVGSLPVADRFSVYGKLGLYRGEVDGNVNTVLVTGSASETNTDVTFGFGARFDFSKQLGARIEWQRYPSVGGPDTGEDDVDLISIGLLFRF